MEIRKLDKNVLKLWYIKASAIALIPIFALAVAIAIFIADEMPMKVLILSALAVCIPIVLNLCFIFIMPALRYKMYSWGYDDKRIVVKQGVIFRQRVVIPICQIQDLHRNQGPIMMMLKLSGVTISTAGSNFNISTLTTAEADQLIDDLERNLEARVEELKNETI